MVRRHLPYQLLRKCFWAFPAKTASFPSLPPALFFSLANSGTVLPAALAFLVNRPLVPFSSIFSLALANPPSLSICPLVVIDAQLNWECQLNCVSVDDLIIPAFWIRRNYSNVECK